MKNILVKLYIKCIGLWLNLLSLFFPKKTIQIAYRLFCVPQTGKLSKNNLPKIIQDAYLEQVTVENAFFQTYTWKGNNTTVLLVHGWESNASRWENLIPILQQSGSTIVAIDAPAHGLSSEMEFSIPQYAQFIRVAVQKFKPRYLIGHSIGGQSCLYYQSIYQNKDIHKIVVLGAPSDFNIIFNNFIALLKLNKAIAKGIRSHYLNHFELDIDYFSSKLFVEKIETKGFIGHDMDDRIVKIEEGKKIASAWKNAVFVETKGLGHSMHNANFYQQLYQFLFEKQ